MKSDKHLSFCSDILDHIDSLDIFKKIKKIEFESKNKTVVELAKNMSLSSSSSLFSVFNNLLVELFNENSDFLNLNSISKLYKSLSLAINRSSKFSKSLFTSTNEISSLPMIFDKKKSTFDIIRL